MPMLRHPEVQGKGVRRKGQGGMGVPPVQALIFVSQGINCFPEFTISHGPLQDV